MTGQKRILIVEDDASMRGAIFDKLSRDGYVILQAEDGAKGLEMALKDKPDVILLDLLLPIMDGMEVLHRIRGDETWGKKVPIIILTNLSADDTRMQGVVRDEPSYYLIKTQWNLDDVSARVKSCLEGTVISQ